MPSGNFPSTEVQGQLRSSGQVTLNSSGEGTVYLSTPSAHQRWEVTQATSRTNQDSTATVVPVVTLVLNANDITTMSPGNYHGASWAANQDSWSGLIHVGPCDFLAVIFSPPAGASAADIAALSGVTCSATISGRKYTRTG